MTEQERALDAAVDSARETVTAVEQQIRDRKYAIDQEFAEPIAAPVCREMRRSQRLKRRLAIAGFVMLGIFVAGIGYGLMQVVHP